MTDAHSGLIILALNSGSSSLKFGLYRVSASRTEALLSGEAQSIGEEGGRFHAQDSQANSLLTEAVSIPTQRDAISRIGQVLAGCKLPAPVAVGHRIVHGGPNLRQHCLIDELVLRQLDAATAFAPLHTPSALSVIRFAQEHFSGIPEAACFDTTFHAGMPEVARVLPIPRELRLEGIQRYGFHGLSCESIVHQLKRRGSLRIWNVFCSPWWSGYRVRPRSKFTICAFIPRSPGSLLPFAFSPDVLPANLCARR